MKSTEEMVALNKTQAGFYDSISEVEDQKAGVGYAEHRSANWLTRLWAGLRYRQQHAAAQSGVEKLKEQFHLRWLETKRGGDFLEIGCFRGTPFTFPLIEHSGAYLGVELSPKAVRALEAKIAEAGLSHKARAVADDFLKFEPGRKFDVIYAHGVLHHFENPEPLFAKIASLLQPEGVLILTEPSTVNPLFKVIRAAYRPFQSDAAWEWPFTDHTVRTLHQHLTPLEGFGWGRNSLFASVLVGMPVLNAVVLPLYLRMVRSETGAGWHPKVWSNSSVTAVCQLKR